MSDSSSNAISELRDLVRTIAENSRRNSIALEKLKRGRSPSESDEDDIQSSPQRMKISACKTKIIPVKPSGAGSSSADPPGTAQPGPSTSRGLPRQPGVINLSRFKRNEKSTLIPIVDNTRDEPILQPNSPVVEASEDESTTLDIEALENSATYQPSISSEASSLLGEIPIVSSEIEPTWSLDPRTLKWFEKVADIELKQDQVDSILEDFVPHEELEEHFTPPMLPIYIWNRIKTESSHDINKQRVVYKSQKLTSSALKPLPTVVGNLDSEDPNLKLVFTI